MFPKEYYDILNTVINVPRGRNVKLLEHKSPYQKIELYQNGKDNWLALNGEMQFHTAESDISHYYMVNVPAQIVGRPKSILIIGGGDGLPAKEALRHPFETIDEVELDGHLVDITKRHPVMRKISNDSFNNKRLNLMVGDGLDFLLNTKRKWDIIVDDCEVEITNQNPKMKEKYERYSRALIDKLNPGGVACIMQPFEYNDDESYDDSFEISKRQGERLRRILHNPKAATPTEINWVHFMMNKLNNAARKHMRQELMEWKTETRVPYIGYKIPVLPQIGPEMYIYMSKDPLLLSKAADLRGVQHIKL